MTTATLCPSCGEAVAEEDDFCESCGTRLHAPPPQEGICPKCGAPIASATDGYCGRCGNRLPRPGDHVELEETGMALVSDKGLRHPRNEDTGAIRAAEQLSVLVVCDGVSTTANPDQASAAAASAMADAVVEGLSADGSDPAAALAAGLAAAQAAVLDAPQEEPGGYAQAPSTTLAAAVVTGDTIVAANVGDSRAYWIDAASPDACRMLSHDHSLAEAAIAAGASPEEAYARRDAHTITHWLGYDAPELAPHFETMTAPGPGLVLVCSDGLWNYFEAPASLRELVAAGPPGETLLVTARRLVDAALEAGGHDNITVALRVLGEPTWGNGPGASPVEAEPETWPEAEAPPVASAEPEASTEPSTEPSTEASPEPEALTEALTEASPEGEPAAKTTEDPGSTEPRPSEE
jgi:serine/threonine protein phosphatase PrpC